MTSWPRDFVSGRWCDPPPFCAD